MRNELKKLKKLKLKSKPLYIICNYDTTENDGIHWISIYKNKAKNIAYYFNSYGGIPFKEAMDFLDDITNRYYSTFQLQKYNERFCGQISLWTLFRLSQGDDFFDCVLFLKNELQ
jgi:hypothetical protein